MTINLTEIYDVTLKKEIRDAAKGGFVRPTLAESFMTHKDFVEIISATVPDPPVIVTATSNGTTTSIQIEAPLNNGGNSIISYTAISTPDNITGVINQSGSGTITVLGLTAGIYYTFKVYATNSIGNSGLSTVSNVVLPRTIIPTYFSGVYLSTLTNNNLTAAADGGSWVGAWLLGFKTSGKWFVEFRNDGALPWFGIIDPDSPNTTHQYNKVNSIHFANNYPANGGFFSPNRGYVGTYAVCNVGEYIGLAFDMDTYTLSVYINGVFKTSYQETNPSFKLSKFTFDMCGGTATVTPTLNTVHYPIYGYNYFTETVSYAPYVPTIGTVTNNYTTASIPFIASENNGGATINNYTAVSTPGNLTGTINQAGSGIITVTGLTVGISYTFKVYATNSIGNSELSATSNAIIPEQAPVAYCTGGVITEADGYRTHTFNSSDNIVIESLGLVELLLVGGGGAGGGYYMNGGGGAGELVYRSGFALNNTGSFPVVIGAGGLGQIENYGLNGGNSTFLTLTAKGGGGGGAPYETNGRPGGSGGGAPYSIRVGGISTAVDGIGNSGGNSNGRGGGGGGGAGGIGGNQGGGSAGTGGVGLNYFGSWFAGGGGGSSNYGDVGGLGQHGGGNGGEWSAGAVGSAGTPNTGGGGGGHRGGVPGHAGGSGILKIRYAI